MGRSLPLPRKSKRLVHSKKKRILIELTKLPFGIASHFWSCIFCHVFNHKSTRFRKSFLYDILALRIVDAISKTIIYRMANLSINSHDPSYMHDRVQHTSTFAFLHPVELDISFVSVSPDVLQVRRVFEADLHACRQDMNKIPVAWSNLCGAHTLPWSLWSGSLYGPEWWQNIPNMGLTTHRKSREKMSNRQLAHRKYKK